MINQNGYFTTNEKFFISSLNKFFESNFNTVNGNIIRDGIFVRYELYLKQETKYQFILEFCVNDENGNANYVYIPSIVIPLKYQKKHIATSIISIMSYIANTGLGFRFYITNIANERWKQKLIKSGGIEDEDGDIIIDFNKWYEHIIKSKKTSNA